MGNAMAGPTDANTTLNAAALVNERKEEPQNGVEDWRIMEASFNRYLLARVISRAPEKWPRLVTEESQRWGIALRS